MATLIQSYEQQYSVLTAEITSKIGRLQSGNEENRDELIKDIHASFEEANDLLEQLELESRGAGAGARVPAYRAELQRVRNELRSVLHAATTNGYAMDAEEAYDDWGANEQQRKLLDNAERAERSDRHLRDGYRVMLETEQVGAAVLEDLAAQRETLQRARARLRDTDGDLSRSTRVLKSMLARAMQDRLVVYGLAAVLAVLACLGLYLYVT